MGGSGRGGAGGEGFNGTDQFHHMSHGEGRLAKVLNDILQILKL